MVLDLWNIIHVSASMTAYEAPSLSKAFFNTLVRGRFAGKWEVWQSTAAAYMQELDEYEGEPESFEWNGVRGNVDELNHLHLWIRRYAKGTRFIITERGYSGLAPAAAQQGDLCSIVFGCGYPCLLTPTGEDLSYQILGSAYILGSNVIEGNEAVNNTMGYWNVLGAEDSKDWLVWCVEEQNIYPLMESICTCTIAVIRPHC